MFNFVINFIFYNIIFSLIHVWDNIQLDGIIQHIKLFDQQIGPPQQLA